MADGFDDEDIFAVFDEESTASTSKKHKTDTDGNDKASSSSERPQTGEKRDLKEVLRDPLLFDVDDDDDSRSATKKQKVIDDAER